MTLTEHQQHGATERFHSLNSFYLTSGKLHLFSACMGLFQATGCQKSIN